jgi:hypothetical protein
VEPAAGADRGGVRHALERDQRQVAVAARAQAFEDVHQLAVRHAAIGAQENAPIRAFAWHRVERTHQGTQYAIHDTPRSQRRPSITPAWREAIEGNF